MCGLWLWGTGAGWTVFAIWLLMCAGFLVMVFRFARTGRGGMCMGGHHGRRGAEDN